MEDNIIKEIFKEFDPELSSSFLFMAKLKKNMEAVEYIRQYNVAQKRRNKLAVILAGVSGFAMGVFLTLLYPFITEWIASLNFSISLLAESNLKYDFSHLGWIVIAIGSVLTSMSVYEAASARISYDYA